MADVKISGLPASTVPLAGTEVLPIVQGGATKQVSITNLTAGKFVTASSVSVGNTTDPGATNLSVTGSVKASQTAGYIGTTTNNNADAGSIGEYITSTVTQASPVALTAGVNAQITTISLTAGDWDVFGNGGMTGALTTGLQYSQIGISLVGGGTLPAAEETWTWSGVAAGTVIFASQTFITTPVPTTRISLSATTTIYLNVKAQFVTSTAAAFGRLSARRIR